MHCIRTLIFCVFGMFGCQQNPKSQAKKSNSSQQQDDVQGRKWRAHKGKMQLPNKIKSMTETPQNVLVIVVDTLRADSVDLNQTPVLDALAKSGHKIQAWSASTWTLPSVMSMFLGMPPRSHGWNFSFPNVEENGREKFPPMPNTETLASVLKDNGFQTMGFYANLILREGLEVERGFDKWEAINDGLASVRLKEEVQSWDPAQKHFVYVHLFGPHQPLKVTPEQLARLRIEPSILGEDGVLSLREARLGTTEVQHSYRQMYQQTVKDIDTNIGLILKALGKFRKNTIIVVTSDHGELLGEHGQWGHHHWVWNQLVEVPMVIRGIPNPPNQMTLDALPDLICDAFGIDHPWQTQSQNDQWLVSQREEKLTLSIDGHIKGVWDPVHGSSAFSVFDTSLDPTESRNLETLMNEMMEYKKIWEERTPQTVLSKEATQMDDSMQEALKSLGYIE